MIKGQNDYLTLENEIKIILSIHCFEFYVKSGKLSLRSGHKNILMIHRTFLIGTKNYSELCFLYWLTKNLKKN